MILSGILRYIDDNWCVEYLEDKYPVTSLDMHRLNSFDTPNPTDPDTYINKEVKFYIVNTVVGSLEGPIIKPHASIAWTKEMKAFKKPEIDEYELWGGLFTEYYEAINHSHAAQRFGRIKRGCLSRDEFAIDILRKKYKLIKL